MAKSRTDAWTLPESTRTLFGFTSPRTLEKIIPEVGLLIASLGGREWNAEAQTLMAEQLADSDFYRDTFGTQTADLSGRERFTRAPKSYGFVSFAPIVELTPAGEALLAGIQIPELFARQLLKFQLPSPFHAPARGTESRFLIRPYLELLRLVRDAGSLSLKEVAMFFLPLTRWVDYPQALAELQVYRQAKSQVEAVERLAFTERYADNVIRRVYHENIAAGRFNTRQGATTNEAEFIAKKRETAGHYADAFMRHLRATQLITLDSRTFHLRISPLQVEQVDYLLATVPRDPIWPIALDEYKRYLGNPNTLSLLQDNESHLRSRLRDLDVNTPVQATVAELQQLLAATQREREQSSAEIIKQELQHFGKFDEVGQFFDKLLVNKPKIPDAPLWFEWNIWRSMVMLNYALTIKPNFKADPDGIPTQFAPGNIPDLEANYESFQLIVEVTLSRGQTQHYTERESVSRHFGKAQMAAPTGVPVYCLFIAPTINPASLALFYNENKSNTEFYGGQTSIIPLSLELFRVLLTRGKDGGLSSASQIGNLMRKLVEEGRVASSERTWQSFIDTSIRNWLN